MPSSINEHQNHSYKTYTAMIYGFTFTSLLRTKENPLVKITGFHCPPQNSYPLGLE